jgi:hypothetical protein
MRNEFTHNKKHIPCSTSAGFLQKYLAEIIKTQVSTPIRDASYLLCGSVGRPKIYKNELEWYAS